MLIDKDILRHIRERLGELLRIANNKQRPIMKEELTLSIEMQKYGKNQVLVI
jgi:hypothetical protein